MFNGHEDQIITNAQEVLLKFKDKEAIPIKKYEELLYEFTKLQRHQHRLIKLSDKQEVLLNDLNNNLENRNELLRKNQGFLQNELQLKTDKIHDITIALVQSLEDVNLLNDTDTGGHIKRVSKISGVLALAYYNDIELADKITTYASLHDIGKVGIPDHILKKEGKFNDEEFEQMKNHVLIGFKMLNNNNIDPIAQNIVKYHHEKWDGTGYTSKKKGKDIPAEARIVAVADVYDALRSKRSYKEPFSAAKAIKIISESSGQHFDPEIVNVFLQNIDDIEKIIEDKTLDEAL